MRRNYLAAGAAMLLAPIAVVCPVSAGAQEFRGTISGTVTDPSGAVVPGAQVEVRQTQTGAVNKTKSDAAGQYVVPFLQPGVYAITVTMPGFQTAARNEVTVQSGEHPIINMALTVGQESQTVEVSADAPLVDQANASVGQVITTAQVEDLPLNGRTPAMLTQLSIGVIATAQPGQVHPFDNNAANSWSIGGTPKQTSEILLDGAPDTIWSGSLAYSPTQDSVQEVSVRAFDTDASFGHTLGGVINQTTKSGTNRLHGSLYEFGQISNLGANSFFNKNKAVPTARPVTHFNQFGLTAGGPIYVPKVFNGRDKLFWFFAWEGLKDSQPTTNFATVPTSAERTGNFSALLAAGCANGLANDPTKAAALCAPDATHKAAYADPNQLYNPYGATLVNGVVTRTPILNNNFSTTGANPLALNPVSLAVLNLFPQPNTTGTATGLNNYLNNAPSTDNFNNEFGRLDWNMSSRSHLFFDMRHNILNQLKNNYFANASTGSTLRRENWGVAMDEVFSLNSTTVIDVRGNWTFFDESHGVPSPGYGPTDFGLPASLASNSAFVQLPYFNFATSGTSCGSQNSFQCLGSTGSSLTPSTSYQLFGDVVKVLGRQTLKVGLDAREYRVSVENYGYSSGGFTFADTYLRSASNGAAVAFGGDLASFLLGLPTSVQYDLPSRADYRSYYYGAFVQDDWRVNDRLTLNLGVRFDKDTPYGEKYGRTVSGFDPNATNAVTAAAAAAYAKNPVAQIPAGAFNTRGGLTFPGGNGGAPYQVLTNMVSPRFGFSLTPFANQKTVFRGGFGLFVTPATLANLNAVGTYSSTAITDQEGFSATTSLSGSTDNFLTPGITLNNPFPSGFTQPAGSSLGASTFLGQSISFLAPVEHDPYAERWDLGVQHTLTPNTLVEFLYVGNHGVHLPVSAQNINAVQRQYLSTLPYRDVALNSAYTKTVPNPFAGLVPNTSLNNATTSVASLLVPYPQFGSSAVNVQNQTIGQSYFNSANVRVEQRMKHGLSVVANYSFSKFIDSTTFLNDQDTTTTRRISPYDATHHFVLATTYHLPLGKGGAFSFGGNRLLDEIFGGFIVNAIYSYQSGNPLYFSADIPLQPGTSLRDISINPRQVNEGAALNTASFVTGSDTAATGGFVNGQFAYHYRTLPQTLAWVRADGINNLDASLLKDFHFTEKTFFQLRFETFNALNHTAFAAPAVSSATSSGFGRITSQANTPRFVQIGGRIVF